VLLMAAMGGLAAGCGPAEETSCNNDAMAKCADSTAMECTRVSGSPELGTAEYEWRSTECEGNTPSCIAIKATERESLEHGVAFCSAGDRPDCYGAETVCCDNNKDCPDRTKFRCNEFSYPVERLGTCEPPSN